MTDRPNIVLFLTDDHAPWTLPCYGNGEVVSPTFDAMARKGAVFNHAFTPSPVCSPGRACLLTGKLPSQHGVHDWISMDDPACQDRDWLADEVTLAQLLGRSGYRCGLSGKWHLGQCDRTPRGYDWYFGFPDFGTSGVHTGPNNYVLNGEPLRIGGNRTKITADRALQFLESTREGEPFFLQVGYIATHSPFTGQDPDLVESHREASFSDIRPADPHPWRWDEDFPEGHSITPEEARVRHQNQYAAVTDMDRNIGRILEHIEGRADRKNTIVIYTSDHGLCLGQKGFWGKGNGTRPLNMYDISTGVPLIVYGDSVRPGTRRDECVDHLDTFCTLCDLCGVAPDQADRPGRSYLPLLRGQSMDWDNTTFGEYGDMRSIRTPELKLVTRYPNGPDELFNLGDDPDENVNLIDVEAYRDVAQKLRARRDAYFARWSDPVKSGLNVKDLPRHNRPQKPSQRVSSEAWRDGIREQGR